MDSNNQENLNQLVSKLSSNEGVLVDYPRRFDSDFAVQDFYQKYGYVSIKNQIPHELLSEIQNTLQKIFGVFSIDSNNPVDSAIIELDKVDKKKLYELHTASSKAICFQAVSVHLNKFLKKISGIDLPILDISSTFLLGIPKDKRLIYNFHQESNYLRGFGDIFNIHYPLFRTSTVENGTMSILPTSHKYGTLAFEKKRLGPDSYTDLIPSNIDKITPKIPEIHCYLEPGDCIIFHKDLIHRSNFNSSQLCRPVGISRFTQSISGDWLHRSPDDL